jgi:sugar phosphate isomerase/epimerase
MRFCCNDTGINIAGDPADSEKRLKRLKEIGLKVIGVGGVESATEDQAKKFKALADKYEIVIAMSPTGAQPAHPDLDKRKEEHLRLRTSLKNMHTLGGDLIHICGGSYSGDGWWYHPKNFTQQGLDDFIEEMKKVAPYAEESGISVCPETTQWCILNSPERMKEYIDRVDSPYIKVTFDIVNHMRPDRITESGRFFKCVLALLGDRIGQLHVKDVNIVDGLTIHINEVPMGTGLLDHETIIKASDDLEPWKTFSIEHFNRTDVDLFAQIESNYKYFKGITDRIGHKWSDPNCTRTRFENTMKKK